MPYALVSSDPSLALMPDHTSLDTTMRDAETLRGTLTRLATSSHYVRLEKRTRKSAYR
jgi:hypothetical protein